jgi:hypothetical protein
MSNEEYRDKDFLLDQLDEILKAMLEEAALSKVVRQAEDRSSEPWS